MTDHLVVARLKTGGFSRSGTPEEVFASLQKLLPVDKLYFLVPHPDGKGYELREVGNVVVDFRANDELSTQETVQSNVSASQPPTSTPEIRAVRPVIDPGQPIAQDPTPPLTQAADFRMAAPETGFKFDKPKSQSEALAERGIQDRAMKMHTPVIEEPTQDESVGRTVKAKKAKSQKKGKKTASAKAQEAELLSDDWDKGLPSTRVSGPGAVQVRSITTATPEEAAAASHFKGF